MTRLDNVIDDQRYILECLELLRRIQESGNCHTCDNKECNCKPELGEMIRYNCPCYKEIASNPIVIRSSIYGSHSYTMEELREEAEKILRERAKKKKLKKESYTRYTSDSDILTVSFDNNVLDKSGLCVTRKCGEKTAVLKMELGEQADILYRLLTEQMTKAEIKEENDG